MFRTTFAAALIAMPTSALAQQGGGGPAQGSVDSSRAVSSTREQNAEYNRSVGARDARTAPQSKAVAASPADVKPGLALRDIAGKPIGTIDAVDADGAILTTPWGKVKIPLVAFGKDDRGLLLGITVDKLQALVAKANSGG